MLKKNNVQLLIPCAGIGKRFLDAGYKNHKCLLSVDNQPIIKQIIDTFPGVEDITIITNSTYYEEIRFIINEIDPNIKILKIDNHKFGPVYTINQIKDYIDDNKYTIVTYCDVISHFNFDKWLEEIDGFDGSVLGNVGFHPVMLGDDKYAVCYHRNNILTEIKEKHLLNKEDKLKEYNSTGIYAFRNGKIIKKYFQKLLDQNISIGGEYYVSLVYNLMVEDGAKIKVSDVEHVINLGTPEQFEEYSSWSRYFRTKNTRLKFCHSSDTTLIIPMAGRGSRCDDYKLPKPLIEMDGVPMFVRAVEEAPAVKDKIFVVLSDHMEKFGIDRIIRLYYPDSKILVLNRPTEGQAETCQLAIEKFHLDLHKPIIISSCDNGVSYNAAGYQNLIRNNKIDVIVWSFRKNQSSRIKKDSYSWLDIGENNYLIKEYSKCYPFLPPDNPNKEHAIIGTMFFKKAEYFSAAFQYNYQHKIKTNGEYYVDDLLNYCVDAGLRVKVFESDHFACWGSNEDIKTYNYYKQYFEKKFGLKEEIM